MANSFIEQRQGSMQDFNKLMRSASQLIQSGDAQDLVEIYDEIELIMKEYPSLFPEDSFQGKTKASIDILEDRDSFNQIAKKTEELASLAKIASKNNDMDTLQQHHQNLFSTCKSCHSRFKD